MTELFAQALENGHKVLHRNYCLYNNARTIAYESGAIRMIVLDTEHRMDAVVTVFFADGTISEWKTKWITSYNFQFGLAVSFEGKYIFVQTWENGLFCLDSRTGERIWKTKSKRGITSAFVNENTLLVHQRERALQLIDMHTGEILKEKCPAKSWGFTAIDHKHIVCQVTSGRWEIIDAATLETKKAISHHDFTGGHKKYCINSIMLDGQELIVRGFQNIWDNTVKPAKMLPNPEFEHRIPVDLNF